MNLIKISLLAASIVFSASCTTSNMYLYEGGNEQFLEAVRFYNPSCILKDRDVGPFVNHTLLSGACIIHAYPECEMSVAKRHSFFAMEADENCISRIIVPRNKARLVAEKEHSDEIAKQALQAEKYKEQLRLEAFNNSPEGKLLIDKQEIQRTELLKKQKMAKEACTFAANEAADKYVLQVLQHMKSDYLGGDNYICLVMFKSGYTPFPAEINYNTDTGRYTIRDL